MGTCHPICADKEIKVEESHSHPLLSNDKDAPALKQEEQSNISVEEKGQSKTEDLDHDAKPHWDYPYDEEAWKRCCNCPPGLEQSPIDLPESLDNLPISFQFELQYTTIPISFGMKGLPKNIVNNGHTIQMNALMGQSLAIKDTSDEYNLLQFHFHTRSEHTVNTSSFALEMHLVHSHKKNGNLLVLGIFFDPCEQENPNDFLASFWDYLPGVGCKRSLKEVPIHLSALKKAIADLSFYNYSGSLTTPPLSEGVTWIVAKEPLRCSSAQIRTFREHSGQVANYRPPQPLNNRQIYQAKLQAKL